VLIARLTSNSYTAQSRVNPQSPWRTLTRKHQQFTHHNRFTWSQLLKALSLSLKFAILAWTPSTCICVWGTRLLSEPAHTYARACSSAVALPLTNAASEVLSHSYSLYLSHCTAGTWRARRNLPCDSAVCSYNDLPSLWIARFTNPYKSWISNYKQTKYQFTHGCILRYLS
jgi:hypothetical protein